MACGSSLKKNCETTNWYDRGYKMAHEGILPAGDFYIKNCTAAGADIDEQKLDVGFKKGREEVCDPAVALKAGRTGNTYNFPVCMNYNDEEMQRAYEVGLGNYCKPGNAYQEGVAGRTYQDVCPNSEDFKGKYFLGREKFLHSSIKSKKQSLAKVESTLRTLENRKSDLKRRLDRRRTFKDEQNRIRSELHDLNLQIDDLMTEKNTANSEIEKLQKELSKI